MYKLYNVKRWGSMSVHFVLEELGVPYQNIWMTPEQSEVVKAKAMEREARLFDLIENRLAKEGPYMIGERFSAADIYLFMLTIWAHASERALLNRSPNIARVAATVRARPRLKASLEAHGVFEPGA